MADADTTSATGDGNQEEFVQLAAASPTAEPDEAEDAHPVEPLDADDDDSQEIGRAHSTLTPSTALQNKAYYRIDPKRYFGLLRGYVRQDWNTVNVKNFEHSGVDELRADWVELFFDLIFVAAIVHLSAEVAYSIPAHDDGSHRRLASSSYGDDVCADSWDYGYVLTAFAQFSILVNGWKACVNYTTHFVMNQRIDDFLRLLFMICILCMGIFVKDSETYNRNFLISCIFLHIVNILRFAKAALIPRARLKAIWHIGVSLTTIILIAVILATVHGACAMDYFWIYVAVSAVEDYGIFFSWRSEGFCGCVCPAIKKRLGVALTGDESRLPIPIHVPHIAERYGLFVMIILGESIISVVSSDLGELDLDELSLPDASDDDFPDWILILFVVVSFVMSYSIGRLYYDCQPSEECIMHGEDNHALRRRGAFGPMMFMFGHKFLMVGLLGLGMGMKITFKHISYSERMWIDVVLPGYALVVITLSLQMIRIGHPTPKDENGQSHPTPKWIWAVRGVILVVMCVAPAFTKMVNNGVLFFVYFICIQLQLWLDVEGKDKRQHEKDELKKKRAGDADGAEHSETSASSSPVKYMRTQKSGVGGF